MPNRIDQRAVIAEALNEFGRQPLPKAARRLFGELGYKSNRSIPVSSPKQFCEKLDPRGKLTDRERESLEMLPSLTLLFQLTDAEFTAQRSLDPYDQNTFAPFFDSEWMFGLPVGKVRVHKRAPVTLLGNFSFVNELAGQKELVANVPKEIDSGFDVVIGNPPYVSAVVHAATDQSHRSTIRKHFPLLKGAFDIYAAFLLQGVLLTNTRGAYSWIVPNKVLVSSYSRSVLGHLKQNGLSAAIDVSHHSVFESTGDYPVIIIGNRGNSTFCQYGITDLIPSTKKAT